MCAKFRQEKKELIQALHKDRKMSNFFLFPIFSVHIFRSDLAFLNLLEHLLRALFLLYAASTHNLGRTGPGFSTGIGTQTRKVILNNLFCSVSFSSFDFYLIGKNIKASTFETSSEPTIPPTLLDMLIFSAANWDFGN